MQKIHNKLTQNIRRIREEKKLTQAELAEKLSMSETGYAKIERGENNLAFYRIEQIADVLGVNLADIIPFDRNPVIDASDENLSISNDCVFEYEIQNLKNLLEAKNEIIHSREREIQSLQKQIEILEKFVSVLIRDKEP